MKKFLALVVACATVASTVAATVFNSNELKVGAPVVMKGTLKGDTWLLDDVNCKIAKGKVSYDAYLAFCQPCINCLLCSDEIGNASTDVKLFIVEKNTKQKKADITKLELNSTNFNMAVTTAPVKGKAKKGDVLVGIGVPSSPVFGDIDPIKMFGTWNQKTWFSGKDEVDNSKYSVILGMVQKLEGSVLAVNDTDHLFTEGELSLRRDDSATKMLMMLMTFDEKGAPRYNPFTNCTLPPTVETDTCTEVMNALDDDGHTFVEAYIRKTLPKSWTDIDINGAAY